MDLLRTADQLGPWHGCLLIPTMGALHAGHTALIRAARRVATGAMPVVATVFVNPTQFNEPSDYRFYPRSLGTDITAAERAGADAVFAPAADVVYPPDGQLDTPPLPAVAREPGLEDQHRPGHFDGVCQVVARLFDLFRPRVAYFGEKDWQQLLVVRTMAAEMAEADPNRWPHLSVVGVPTVREDDGLALSSRNQRLSPEARQAARGIPRALQTALAAQHPKTAESMMRETLEAHGLEVEYAAVRDAATLRPIVDFTRPARGLIAVRAGDVRLIDNGPMAVWS